METGNNPLVSIGIPTYRRPAELRETLIQILSQTYKNIDVIVSDNGSEGSEVTEVVQQFMSVDKRIRFFRQKKNIGPIKNFQFVLDQAIGEYFMWCADDDWHAPEFIALMVAQLEADAGLVLAFCNLIAIDPDGCKVTSYDDFLPSLQKIAISSRLLRRWQFFMQPEWRGKANLFYGLMRRQQLEGFNWIEFTQRYGINSADNLFVFTRLELGGLGLVQEQLYASRVGNVKHYLAKRQRFARVRILYAWAKYLKQYLRLVTPPLIPAYFLGAVIKTVLFLLHNVRLVFRRMYNSRFPDRAGN